VNRRVRRTLAVLALTAAALSAPSLASDLAGARADTAWGAEQTLADTAWGIPPVDVPPVADPIVDIVPLDTAWG